ncbi:MAG: FAD:protein FMN transferase [Proteobacteria bacterium]|nr:FAD:protein FMN transferase [Pseudomonadota bacterium]MCP4916145.1 FAD:protein FMN transferase [Pseudomonadota bacterium]
MPALRRLGPAFALISLSPLLTAFTPPAADVVTARRELMGTGFEVQIPSSPAQRPEAERAAGLALDEVARIEQLMSSWLPRSELAQVNQQAGGAPVEVSSELLGLVRRALDLCQETGGLFDITYRPLAQLWSLSAEPFVLPEPSLVAAARDYVGCDKVRVDEVASTVRLSERGMSIGLGGIAKGYAVDRASELLVERGFEHSMVDGGGDVLARGRGPGGSWNVGVQHPREPLGTVVGSVAVSDRALVTSGDYLRFVEHDGERYHHILDPRTGFPAQGLMSVSVLAGSAERADALATALFVAGPKGATELLATLPDVDALLILEDGEWSMTEGFAAAMR